MFLQLENCLEVRLDKPSSVLSILAPSIYHLFQHLKKFVPETHPESNADRAFVALPPGKNSGPNVLKSKEKITVFHCQGKNFSPYPHNKVASYGLDDNTN